MILLNFILPTTLAYLDPGSGSLLIQLIVGGIVGFMVFFRGSITAVLRYLGLKSKPEDEDEDDLDQLVDEEYEYKEQ
ncbi:MAG: hypothetical protein AAF846_14295 [Chloroflexota bacterium]